jgi:hypothetical protein
LQQAVHDHATIARFDAAGSKYSWRPIPVIVSVQHAMSLGVAPKQSPRASTKAMQELPSLLVLIVT